MLAQVFNTTADSIMELNPGVDPRNLQVGHVITIRPGFQYYPPFPIDNNMMDNNGMINNGMTGNNGMMNNGMMNNGMMNNGMMNNGMMNNGMMNNGMMNNGMMDYECGMLADLTDYFRMLWGQHVMWTRMVMIGILFELPELEFSTQRLLRNARDFANALGIFYDDEVAQSFENLFSKHITIAAELINAANAGDTNQVDAIWQRWADNANQIAEFLGSINPNWNSEDWSAMLMEHLELLGDNLTNLLEKNYQASVEGFDNIEMQAMEMADMMAEGIAIQFPD
jgi:hypothetical protein